jgi:hypothetical protein
MKCENYTFRLGNETAPCLECKQPKAAHIYRVCDDGVGRYQIPDIVNHADEAREYADAAEQDSETSGKSAHAACTHAKAAVDAAEIASAQAWEAARHGDEHDAWRLAIAAGTAAVTAQEAVLHAARAQLAAGAATYNPGT